MLYLVLYCTAIKYCTPQLLVNLTLYRVLLVLKGIHAAMKQQHNEPPATSTANTHGSSLSCSCHTRVTNVHPIYSITFAYMQEESPKKMVCFVYASKYIGRLPDYSIIPHAKNT